MVTVSEATEVTAELVEAFERLVPQLSSSSPPPGHAELVEIVGSAASILLVARDRGGTIVGSLTLAVFRVPTGLRAWIEDVVVDESARGAGAGEALVQRGVGAGGGARGPNGRPHLPPQPRGGQPALPPPGIRAPDHQRVPVLLGRLRATSRPDQRASPHERAVTRSKGSRLRWARQPASDASIETSSGSATRRSGPGHNGPLSWS